MTRTPTAVALSVIAAACAPGHAAPPCGTPVSPLEIQLAPKPRFERLGDLDDDGVVDL